MTAKQQKKTRGRKKAAKAVQIVVSAPKAKRRNAQRQRRTPGPRMSECARKYLAAVARPFSTEAAGACLPFPPDRDSLKCSPTLRFIIETAAGQTSWQATISPCLANDAPMIMYGATALPWGDSTGPSPSVGVLAKALTSLPFNGGAINNGTISGRIVSVGFRVTYLGTVSTMSGEYYSYSEPGHNSVNFGVYSDSNVLTANETKVIRVTDRPFECGFTLVRPEEQTYSGVSRKTMDAASVLYPWSPTDIEGNQWDSGRITGSPPITFGVIGVPENSSFMVEIIEHVEFVGKGASFGLTPSHNDHNAANVIVAAADRAQGEYTARPEATWASTVLSTLSNVASETASFVSTPVGSRVVGATMRAASTYVRNRAARRIGNRHGSLMVN